jgi:hypothetical protein
MFLSNPGWQVVFDNDPDLAVATRHKVYDFAAAEKMAVAIISRTLASGTWKRTGRATGWCR